MDADAVELRILGCLIEKQRTTPDVYPLTLNALRAACNQSTNREPVVGYDESTIRGALERLADKRWTRLASGAGGRIAKYRHLLDETLGLDHAETALLAVLMLRGPQTPGELRARSERLHSFSTEGELEATVGRLVERGFAARLARRPGQKEARYAQLLGAEVSEGQAPVGPTPGVGDSLRERVERLEAEVEALREELSRRSP